MKVCLITCNKEPNYVRSQSLRAALRATQGVELIDIANTHKGLLRYPEVIFKVIATRLTKRPDSYILAFRAYEVLPFVNVLTWPKPLIWDEFLNPIEWLQEPRPQQWARLIPQGILKWFYKLLLIRPRLILADTPEHAKYSQQVSGIKKAKYRVLSVGTDEAVFKPLKVQPKKRFTVFTYSTLIPLHGTETIITAALKLHKRQDIEFKIICNNRQLGEDIRAAQAIGARIELESNWVPTTKIAQEAAKSQLCLGGPFGDTTQSQYVITGKTFQFMALGRPTIVGRNKVKTPFKDRQNSLIVPQKDAQALAEAIEWAADHPKELARIGQAGREVFEEYYSTPVTQRQVQQLLDELA